MYNNEDRRWMYDRENIYGDTYLNPAYEVGVDSFLDHAFSQTQLLQRGKARCPCVRCCNRRFGSRDDIQFHLYKWGFLPQYHIWTAHGERENNYQQFDINMGESSRHNVEDRHREMVEDAFAGRFENINNFETGNEEPNDEAKAFFEMVREAEEPIKIGEETTILRWVAEFLNNKVLSSIPNVGCEKNIQLIHKWLSPADRLRLPDSMYSMQKYMSRLGLGYTTFDVCVNNCFLFYGDFEDKKYIVCPVCNEKRFEERQNMIKGNKLVARKKLWYLPLTPRLQRLYMSRVTAEHMTWHLKCRGDSDQMIHPASGEAWKSFDATHPVFASEPRNVRLGICTDGFNPHANSTVTYSCWPVFVTPYNLPPDLCMRQEYIFLSLLISGPKSPGKNIDVMLRPLIDELKSLWEVGIETYDSFRKQNFQMRASVLWTISDFPGYGMLSQWSTHGRLSCPYCMEGTTSFQLKHGRKNCFFDCHRRFLPVDHPFRDNTTDFLKDKKEESLPLPRRSGEEMWLEVESLPENVPFGSRNVIIQGFGKFHNWCRKSIFWELPYWPTNMIRHNLDVMHCEKNFFDNIKNTVMDDPEKTKDNLNARRDLQLLTSRRELFLHEGRGGRLYKKKAKYCLSKEQKRLVCGWLRGLRFPDGYASNISRCVQMEQLKLHGMKSHDCHVFMQRLIPIAFRDLLPDTVWGPLVEVSNFFRALCSSEIRKSEMELLEASIVETMCKLEKIFPPSFFDSMEHLAIHLPWEAKVGGPIQYRWMYPFERCMLVLKRSVGNKARIEGSIVKAYLTREIVNFCALYFGIGVETRTNRLNRNEVERPLNTSDELSVFQNKGKPMGRHGRSRNLTLAEHKAAELYVLLNCVEVDCWIRLFEYEMCSGMPENLIQERRNTYFVDWFKQVIQSRHYAVDQRLQALVYSPLRRVKVFKAYKINGFRFHTEAHGRDKKTMNSGVYVKGNVGGSDNPNFYGMLQEIIELEYWGSGRLKTVVLFKCDWYDIYNGMRTHPAYHLVDINPHMRLETGDVEPFILASQAQQVYYTEYPSQQNTSRRGWWAVCTTRARYVVDTTSIYQDNSAPVVIPVLDLRPLNLADDEFQPVDDRCEHDREDEYGDVNEEVGDEHPDEHGSLTISEEEDNTVDDPDYP